jgi:hypothetical protein
LPVIPQFAAEKQGFPGAPVVAKEAVEEIAVDLGK